MLHDALVGPTSCCACILIYHWLVHSSESVPCGHVAHTHEVLSHQLCWLGGRNVDCHFFRVCHSRGNWRNSLFCNTGFSAGVHSHPAAQRQTALIHAHIPLVFGAPLQHPFMEMFLFVVKAQFAGPLSLHNVNVTRLHLHLAPVWTVRCRV